MASIEVNAGRRRSRFLQQPQNHVRALPGSCEIAPLAPLDRAAVVSGPVFRTVPLDCEAARGAAQIEAQAGFASDVHSRLLAVRSRIGVIDEEFVPSAAHQLRGTRLLRAVEVARQRMIRTEVGQLDPAFPEVLA